MDRDEVVSCLFCASPCPIDNNDDSCQYQEIVSSSDGPPPSPPLFEEDSPLVREQLKSLFILRRILHIPNEGLVHFLGEREGNSQPELWAKVCNSCSPLVRQFYDAFKEVARLEKILEGLETELKGRIVESKEKELKGPTATILDEIRSHMLQEQEGAENEFDNDFAEYLVQEWVVEDPVSSGELMDLSNLVVPTFSISESYSGSPPADPNDILGSADDSDWIGHVDQSSSSFPERPRRRDDDDSSFSSPERPGISDDDDESSSSSERTGISDDDESSSSSPERPGISDDDESSSSSSERPRKPKRTYQTKRRREKENSPERDTPNPKKKRKQLNVPRVVYSCEKCPYKTPNSITFKKHEMMELHEKNNHPRRRQGRKEEKEKRKAEKAKRKEEKEKELREEKEKRKKEKAKRKEEKEKGLKDQKEKRKEEKAKRKEEKKKELKEEKEKRKEEKKKGLKDEKEKRKEEKAKRKEEKEKELKEEKEKRKEEKAKRKEKTEKGRKEENDDNESSASLKYQCSQCPYESRYKQSLDTHLAVHQKKPGKENCDACGLVFFKTDLASHRKLCRGSRTSLGSPSGREAVKATEQKLNGADQPVNYACSQCPYQARNKMLLDRHQKLHLGENGAETCEGCQIVFSKNGLISHRPFCGKTPVKHACAQCPYENKNKKLVEKHQKLHQQKEDVETCEGCQVIFSKLGLKSHRPSCKGLEKPVGETLNEGWRN